MALAFEQQPKESHKAFAAFSLYLSMGPERSTEAVARKLEKSEQLVRRWSSRWDWTDRVQAYATHMALVERESTEALLRLKGVDWLQRQEEHRAEEWEVRGELVALAREAIARWYANKKRCGSLEGIARLMDLASRLGRLSSGMPTDRTEVKTETNEAIRIELDVALDKVYGKPLPGEVVEVEEVPGENSKLQTPSSKEAPMLEAPKTEKEPSERKQQ